MTDHGRIVTKHMVRWRARKEHDRLEDLKLKGGIGDVEARAELERLGVLIDQGLRVRKEDHRRYRWAVVTA